MKKLLIARIIVYTVLVLQCAAIIYMSNLLADRGFSSKNMWSAYRSGCQIGYMQPLTEEVVTRCDFLADMYKSVLDAPVLEVKK